MTVGHRSFRVFRILGWVAAIGAAIAIGLYAAPAFPAGSPGARPMARVPGPPPNFSALLYQLGVGSVVWYIAVVSVPLLLLLARRIDADRFGRLGSVATIAGGTLLLIAITSTVDYIWTYGRAPNRPPLVAWIPLSLRQHVLPWLAIVGGVAALEARRRTLRTVLERERLRAEVAEQRLVALAGQLRPHFLFNALQAVSTLIHRDPDAADEMLLRLSDLLRDVLRHRESSFVQLEEEVRYARTWLEIAKVRFADRLTFEIDVPVDLQDASVPLFILQPLVENALGHGIGGVLEGGRVTVRARAHLRRLILEVIDDGAGLGARAGREGIGLTNTRERLQASFGNDQHLSLEPGPIKGAIARVDLPLKGVTVAVPA